MNLDEASSAVLSADELDIVRRFGTTHLVDVGAVLFTAGDAGQAFFAVESGEVEILRPATPDSPETVLVVHGAGRFIGELNLLSGQRAYLTARVLHAGSVIRVEPTQFAQLMRQETAISTTILRAFVARRAYLRVGEGAKSVEMLGSRWSRDSLALRSWASRLQIPHRWIDLEDPEGAAFGLAVGVDSTDLPCVVTPTATLRRATPRDLARDLGLEYAGAADRVRDVVVVGGGPAGLAAAVCAASEGLDTLLVDGAAIGGQAAASARIENFIGFPSGIAGAELTSRALVQAYKFGATVSGSQLVSQVTQAGEHLGVVSRDGTTERTRAVIIATGATYRKLPIVNWDRFTGTSVFYAATEMEARACTPQPVVVVGGANSAGQASIFLAGHGSPVTLVVRGPSLAKSMSEYLIGRIEADLRITVVTSSEITALHGDRSVETVSLASSATDSSWTQECRGVFCFIGAAPATDFLTSVATDAHGFIQTGQDLSELDETWSLLDRRPLPFEASVPGVFAVGDVRSGSTKRIAAAVGEGAAAVASVHMYLGPRG